MGENWSSRKWNDFLEACIKLRKSTLGPKKAQSLCCFLKIYTLQTDWSILSKLRVPNVEKPQESLIFFSAFFRKQLEAHWTVPESCWLFLSQANFCSLKSLSNLLILVQMTLPWTSINTANISSIHPVFIMIFHFLEISSDKSEAFLKVGVVSQAILHFHNLQQFIYTQKKSPVWVHSCCL